MCCDSAALIQSGLVQRVGVHGGVVGGDVARDFRVQLLPVGIAEHLRRARRRCPSDKVAAACALGDLAASPDGAAPAPRRRPSARRRRTATSRSGAQRAAGDGVGECRQAKFSHTLCEQVRGCKVSGGLDSLTRPLARDLPRLGDVFTSGLAAACISPRGARPACGLGRAAAAQRRVGDDPHVDAGQLAQQPVQQRATCAVAAGEAQTADAATAARACRSARRCCPARARRRSPPRPRPRPPRRAAARRASRRAGAAPPGARDPRARRPPGRAHDEHVELGVQALRRAPRAAHDALGLRRERRQREQALGDRLRRGVRDAPAAPSSSRRDDRRSARATRRLTSTSSATWRSAVSRSAARFSILKKLFSAACTRSGAVDLARAQARDQRLRREVDQHDLVGRREHLVGDRLAHVRAGQLRRPGR